VIRSLGNAGGVSDWPIRFGPPVRILDGQYANECDYSLQMHIYVIMEPTVAMEITRKDTQAGSSDRRLGRPVTGDGVKKLNGRKA